MGSADRPTSASATTRRVDRNGPAAKPPPDDRLLGNTNLSNTNWPDLAGIRTDFQGLAEYAVTNYPKLSNSFFRTLTP